MATPEHASSSGSAAVSSDQAGGAMESAELLQNLRDIHLPDPVIASSFSSLAGWLTAGLLIAIACMSWIFWQSRRKTDPKTQALRELDIVFSDWKKNGSAAQYLEHSGIIIKRLALHIADRADTARISGNEWVQWMQTRSDRPLTAQAQVALSQERYKRTPDADISALHQTLSHWIKHCEQVYRA